MPVLFQNHQWQVDEGGIRSKGDVPDYAVDAELLLMTTNMDSETLYDWPLYMAQKSWVDFDAFCEAFERALVVHSQKIRGSLDQRMLEASLKRGRCLHQERRS